MDGDARRNAGTLLLIAALALSGAGMAQAATSQKKPPKAAAANKRLVCWEEDGGRRACGDSVPTQYAFRERTVLDGNGRTVKVIPGAMTAEQRAEHEARGREVAAQQKVADQKAAYDRALLATYSRPEELAALRDDRLGSLDTRIELAEAGLKRDSVSLAELRSRLPAADSGEKPTPRLLNQIKGFEDAVAGSQRALGDMRKERDNVCTTFANDIQRFQELKSGIATYQSPCPAPGSLAPPAATASNTSTVKMQPKVK